MKTYTTTVLGLFDEDYYFIKIPDDILHEVGWKSGDQVEWILNDNGSVNLMKVKK